VPDKPCPACADLRARLDAALFILARASWLEARPGTAMLGEDDWRECMALLAPPAEGEDGGGE
jgi:hypothetical protein